MEIGFDGLAVDDGVEDGAGSPERVAQGVPALAAGQPRVQRRTVKLSGASSR
ncbi:hypothetical protein [Streptomyces sp. NPDC058086]|uniref:hypothetical protein n=1 Tax=Streptomyces sp. NPDC058086 TaxID=3346334 RepID=UPI0036DFDC02